MIDAEFGGRLLLAFNSPEKLPVHQLFNEWWSHAPAEVSAGYVDQLLADDRFREFIEVGWFAEPLDLAQLGDMVEGSLGLAYHHWIVDNGLTASIAVDYRQFHEMLEGSGRLDAMPTELRFAILRGFQVHDFLHVLTGYDASPRGEIALQAFSLAQFPFPYFGMWMSIVTTQMTFHRPSMIVPTMDAISDGWQYGRATSNLMVEPWETMLEQPLDELRERLAVVPSPVAARIMARAA